MNLSAVLLAGGASRRMGCDKATLVVAGQPLWARQLAVLRDLQPDALWISSRLPPSWCPVGTEVLLDAPPSQGPLSGVAAALRAAQTSHVLVLAIDLPRMTTGFVRRIWALARPGCGVVPKKDGGPEPLCACYPREALSLAESALTGADCSMRSYIQALERENRLEWYSVSPEERVLFHNLNTPADWLEGKLS